MENHRPDLKEKVDATLAAYGGLYTFDDILVEIAHGSMQSFSEGDSWAVTQVCNYPRKRVLVIEFAIGNLEELKVLEERVIEFARSHNLDMIMANGRLGFDFVKTRGWAKVSAIYIRDLSDDQ